MNLPIQPTKDSPLKASGRFGRLSYLAWQAVLFNTLMLIGLIFALLMYQPNKESDLKILTIFTVIFFIFLLPVIYTHFTNTIRRLHDLNRSGWWSIIIIIPLVDFIFYIYLISVAENKNPNSYGAPRITPDWKKVFAGMSIFMLYLIFLGLISQLLIPMTPQ